ncbi:MAG: dephospho-CoA kinase [Phycisphaerae bacterium]|nr:dephospho-CoA kinase [Phycisphaerae bacterium]
MSVVGKKPIIGILGGIGSGKSTVANEFGKLGCGVVNADNLAHALLDEEGVRDEVVGVFGGRICDSSGRINRRKLAGIVFADAEKLSLLNKIIHPLVLEEAESLIRQYNEQSNIKAVVLDMPLLVEVGWDKHCDKLVFVECDRQLRSERAGKTGIFGENEQKIRENSQISLDSKVGLADNTIDNNSDFSELVRQVADIFSSIIDSC